MCGLLCVDGKVSDQSWRQKQSAIGGGGMTVDVCAAHVARVMMLSMMP